MFERQMSRAKYLWFLRESCAACSEIYRSRQVTSLSTTDFAIVGPIFAERRKV